MSDSVQPHRRQPTRLPHPWDSPGKNTGVGCHSTTINSKSCRECREKGTFIHCGWGWKLVQPLQKVLWRVLKNLRIRPPCTSPIPLLDIYPKNTETQPKRPMHPYVHCNIICSQDKDSQSICQWVNG